MEVENSCDMDNDASTAGMDEIKGHIGVLTARMKQLGASGGHESKAAESVLDDISDYYERAVQVVLPACNSYYHF